MIPTPAPIGALSERTRDAEVTLVKKPCVSVENNPVRASRLPTRFGLLRTFFISKVESYYQLFYNYVLVYLLYNLSFTTLIR